MGVQTQKIVASLDIGSNKIVCLVGYINAMGKVCIKGIGHQQSNGIQDGKIINKKPIIATEEELAAAYLDFCTPLATLYTVTINKDLPAANYITNNSSYPDAAYYSNGGLKMNYVNMGVLTDKFEAQSKVKVAANILALNQNTKSGTDADAFTAYGLNEAGQVVATASANPAAAGEFVIELTGEGIVQVKLIMTDYPNDGTKFCNVSLGGLTVTNK